MMMVKLLGWNVFNGIQKERNAYRPSLSRVNDFVLKWDWI